MENTVMVESMDRSEARSESLGQKRPLENGLDRELGNKKARGGSDDVRLTSNVKKVAEILLVLATTGKMRAGRKPTSVEMQMMTDARDKLADVCIEFAPKDIFPRDAFGTVIEELGLNRLGEQRLGIRPPKMSIAEKLQITKQKLQSNLSGTTESRGMSNSVLMFPSDKANYAIVSSGSFQNPSNVVHTSAANSQTLPFQLPTSEVRPGVLNGSLSLPVQRAKRPHFRLDTGANGSYKSQSPAILSGDHTTGKTTPWFMQPQSVSFAKVGSDDLTTDRIQSKPFITQITSSTTNLNYVQHRTTFIQTLAETHSEIIKIVQKLLNPHLLDRPTWIPPSRDCMNKALTCQLCKDTINEVDIVLVCDACERGYHLKCLHFNPKSIPRGKWQEWHCAKCLAISNGKPLPPKYGCVMRNINTSKLLNDSVVNQPSLDKKLQPLDTANQPSLDKNMQPLDIASQSFLDKNLQPLDMNVNQQINQTKPNNSSKSHLRAGYDGNLTEMQVIEKNESGIDKLCEETCVSSSIERSNEEEFPKDNLGILHNGRNLECGSDGVIEEDDQGDLVKTSDVNGEQVGSSLTSVHQVEWVGGLLKEINRKTYYQSCCINGAVYKLKDYALFISPGNKYLPNKLQAMWEDGNTTKKWVTVARCFFPDDLPEGVGRPCAPESNEVYESNHESTLAADLIHGSCEVLPPNKFSEEGIVQTRLRARGTDRPRPLFLCKWFYDETKRLFRDVSC